MFGKDGLSSAEPDQYLTDPQELGDRLMAAADYEAALKAYLRAAGEKGLTAEILSSIGTANLMLGRLGQAEEQLRQAAKMDETNPAIWNNLGAVLMETGQYGEASRVFRLAYGLDSGESAEIRENLRIALAKLENPDYTEPENNGHALVRQGTGQYLLLTKD